VSGSLNHAGRRPALSVVIPVYGVADYLRECLDSILCQAGGEVEIIGVDDCSPDSSGAILAEYAARDPRVRAMVRTANGGAGEARNTGFDQARGEYVWFVDGDDWLPPGSIAAVIDRTRRDELDVLLVGYERHFSDGRRFREKLLAPGPALPDAFAARQQPRVLTSLHLAANKIIRRSFLIELGIRWTSGWYEDVAYMYPVLLAAPRIGVLERVCYGYRQRPEGAATTTLSGRHIEVFDKWQQVAAAADDPAHAELRPLVAQRMIVHYLGVLNHPSRVVRSKRREFFARIVRDYRRLRPAAGYPRPGGVANLTFALVAANAFGFFEVLRAIYRTRTTVWRAAGAIGRAVRRTYYWAQRRLPIRRLSVIYAAGTHEGYAGSPYARPVNEVVERAGPFVTGTEIVVVGDAGASDASCHPLQSWTALRAFARARQVIIGDDLPTSIVVRRGQRIVELGPEPTPTILPTPRVPAGTASPNADQAS
jgi:CDP-glycerol glycerophosphotransferase